MDEIIENNLEDLVIYKSLKADLCGTIIKMNDEEVIVKFTPTEQMIDNVSNLVHSGFIFNTANYAAMCLVNKENSLTISAEVQFLAPIELEQEIYFFATIQQANTKKYKVLVKGTLLDIKIFEATFHVSVFEKELFKLNFKEQ